VALNINPRRCVPRFLKAPKHAGGRARCFRLVQSHFFGAGVKTFKFYSRGWSGTCWPAVGRVSWFVVSLPIGLAMLGMLAGGCPGRFLPTRGSGHTDHHCAVAPRSDCRTARKRGARSGGHAIYLDQEKGKDAIGDCPWPVMGFRVLWGSGQNNERPPRCSFHLKELRANAARRGLPRVRLAGPVLERLFAGHSRTQQVVRSPCRPPFRGSPTPVVSIFF